MTNWPHAPLHIFNEKGTYIVTGATLQKELLFKKNEELDLLQGALLDLASHYQWQLEAWAIFSNHYHFIAQSPHDPSTLKKWISHLHATTAKQLNLLHQKPGRKIWHQYWDTQLTFQTSYLARLNYVMQNPVKHGLVTSAKDYKWCSMAWFEKNVPKSHFSAVTNVKTDALSIVDDF